ncbi:unnamed protein product [Calypogeia fissa]
MHVVGASVLSQRTVLSLSISSVGLRFVARDLQLVHLKDFGMRICVTHCRTKSMQDKIYTFCGLVAEQKESGTLKDRARK